MIPPNLIYRMRKQHRPVDRRKQHRPKLSVKDFTARPYLLAAGGMFFAFLGVYFGFVYIVSFASTELKLSTTAATNLPIFMLAANLPGRLLPGLISDRCIGPLNTVIPGLFLSAGCVALWMSLGDGHNTGGALTVIACFYGFASAGLQALYAPAVMSLCLKDVADSTPSTTKKREEPGNAMGDPMGLKSGVIYTCIGFACLIGTPIGGALVKYRTDKHLAQPYLGAQIFTMLCLLLGGALLLASRVARVGWRAQRA